MLTGGASTPVVGSMSSPVEAATAWDLQLQPRGADALSVLLPAIAADGATIGATSVPGLYVVRGPAAAMGALGPVLAASPGIAYAGPEHTMQLAAAPNDPHYTNGLEWQLKGTWGINAPTAWNVTTGSNGVTVADVDTGLNYNLADMAKNAWLNQAEIPSSVKPKLTDVNGDGRITFSDLNNAVNQGPGKIIDTNGDGVITGADAIAPKSSGGWASDSTQDGATSYPDDLIGWNFVSNTNNPMDDNGHGTFTAGEIGAVGNNGIGVTGVAWTSQVMPVKFLDDTGSGSDSAAASAIEYAVDHGAKVINASWGGAGSDQVIQTALQYANQHGVIVVCAAGNSGTNDDTTFFVPASYSAQDPNVITVAATDSNGVIASWSNYGTGTVQLAAPGVNVYSLTSSGGDGYLSGTSMAAPMVTGTIALVEAAHPTWSMSQVIDAVLDHTTADPNLAGKVRTGGIVNAGAAVANTNGPHVVSSSPVGSIAAAGGLTGLTVTFNEEVDPATFTPSHVTVTGPNGRIGGVTVSPVSGSNDHKFTISFAGQTAPGTYSVTVGPAVKDWYGNEMNQNGNGVNGEPSDASTATLAQNLALSLSGLPSSVTAGTSQGLTVAVRGPSGATDVHYVGTIHFTSTDPKAILPAKYTFTAADAGTHTFSITLQTPGTQSVTATDTKASSLTATATATVAMSSANSASFLKQDGTTGGNWIGAYGSQGYDIMASSSSLPSYATVTPSGQTALVWQANSPDARALQNPGGSGRIASTWYAVPGFGVDVNLTDGKAHDVALYLYDWSMLGRTETVQVADAGTGAVLDTRTLTASQLDAGMYLQWKLSGRVVFKLTASSGRNALLNGLFFDPPAS